MTERLEESLLKAIKSDDVKAFVALREKVPIGSCRLGRFPALSLMYLYNSRKLLKAFEAELLRTSSYEVLPEPIEISAKFAKKAKKCLRLYFNEVVSPLEMLLILDKTSRLKKAYPLTDPSSAVRGRLKAIYSIKYSLGIKYDGNSIRLDRRPLSRREKRRVLSACIGLVLTIAIVVGVPVATTMLIPKPVEGEVSSFEQLRFEEAKTFTLTQDIAVPDNFRAQKWNCNIVGGGKKLILGKGASLGELGGQISNLTIETSGDTVFTTVAEKAVLDNVTVNVKVETETSKALAFVAETNYGRLNEVTLNVAGSLVALAPADSDSDGESEDVSFGGFVLKNDCTTNSTGQAVYSRGVIDKCTVNYDRLTLSGETSANAAFAGIAAVNNGWVQNCVVKGEIIADTFDVAGVCTLNNYSLYADVNEANISQTSTSTSWNPIVCGIVQTNANTVKNCENKGKLSSKSQCGSFETQEGAEYIASVAGIAYLNRNSSISKYIIDGCVNSGDIESSAEYRNAYAAGICLSSSGEISGCTNGGRVSATANNGCDVYAGGITALTYKNVSYCINDGSIWANGSRAAYVGGISAHSCDLIIYCVSRGQIAASAKEVQAGGILGFSDIYHYGGCVAFCISEVKLGAVAVDAEKSFVGGVVGYVREAGFNINNEAVYYGGSVVNCYFAGETDVENSSVGNIAGACGLNIYESNQYTISIDEVKYQSFDKNYYVENTFGAFGNTVDPDGNLGPATDKGANSVAGDLKASEGYKEILDRIQSERQT